MSSSSALKYKIQNKPSSHAKALALILLLLSALLLFLLWGVGWFSAVVLIIYISVSFNFIYSSRILLFSCSLSDLGDIEISSPTELVGKINYRSFYNRWIIVLCVEVTDQFDRLGLATHNKPKKWFVVFFDSLEKTEFHLLARLIHNIR